MLALVTCERSAPFDALTAEYRQLASRPCTLRLSGMPHRPPPNHARAALAPRADVAAKEILAEPGKHSLHEIGLAQLVANRHAAAVRTLTRSASRTRRADAWTDLAVAQYELAVKIGDERLFVSALASADQAIEEGAGAAAAFNRAHVLEKLSLFGPAVEAWKRFLELEPDSEWSREARERILKIDHPPAFARWQKTLPTLESAVARNEDTTIGQIVRTFPQYARTWAESDHLSRWGEATVKGDTAAAAEALRFARAVGLKLADANGEELLRDAVEAIDKSHDASELAHAHVEYRAGRKAIAARLPSEAIPLLVSAERRFLEARSPMALIARCYRATAVFDSRDARKARQLLESIDYAPGYLALQAQILWEQARIASRTGDHYSALTLAMRATEIFDRLGEPELAARNRAEAASDLVVLGRASDAARVRVEAFRDASLTGRPGTIEAVLHAAARDEVLEGRLSEARSLFNVMSALPSASPQLRFDAALWKTFIDARLGRQNSGAADLQALGRAAAAVPDVLRADAEDELRFAEALLTPSSNSLRAVALLSHTIEFRRAAGRATRLASALVERGRTLSVLGDHTAAERDLSEALSLAENEREAVLALELRDSFFDAARDACRELLSIYIARNDVAATLNVVQRCRARALLDVAPSQRSLRDAKTLQRELPPATVLLVYATAGEKTVIIAVSNARMVLRVVGSRRRTYDDLIAPVEDVLRDARKVVIFPDETTAHVPFSSLRDSTGKYLIERYELAFAFSAAAWSRNKPMRGNSPQRAMVVGDPAFSDERYPLLERLPSAAIEARRVASMYPAATLLHDDEATEPRVIAEAAQADVIHIASHAVVNSHDSRMSALLVAGSATSNGLLSVSEITNLRLKQRPLVVLAGCTTALEGGGRGSIDSIAAAFLAAGARGVVATILEIDDAESLYFSTSLHRHLRTGKTPAAAVRAAQLEMLSAGRTAAWSGFQFYGFE